MLKESRVSQDSRVLMNGNICGTTEIYAETTKGDYLRGGVMGGLTTPIFNGGIA
jgi:hypothetical protein